jgi:hypothetical protein
VSYFKSPKERAEAERVLRDGTIKGSFTAAGYALIVDRLDSLIQIAGRLERNLEGRADR